MNDRIFFFVIRYGRRSWWLASRRGSFLVFPPFFFNFFFFPFMESLYCLGLLSDGPYRSIFLSVVPSSASASVLYIEASITEIINRPSLIIIIIIFLGDVSNMTWSTRFFTIWNHTTIAHDICARREKLKEIWRQGLHSIIPVEVAGMQY